MSKEDILNSEITRREEENKALAQAELDLIAAIEQFNKLDELFRSEEQSSRDNLEGMYKENRHFTGEWPIVYSFAETEIRPYFASTDIDSNPYYPVTKVQDGSFDGVAPFPAPITRTGDYGRQRSFSPTEDVARLVALTELQSFPNISGEPLPANFPAAQASQTIPGYCTPTATPDTEAQCSIEGGVWTPESTGPVPDPVWIGPNTAPALLRVALNSWRSDLVIIIADLANSSELTFWQAIVDDIDLILPNIATDAVFVRNDPNPDPATWGQTQAFTGSIEVARARLEALADAGVPSHISTRSAKLTQDSELEENIFFGLIELRLHQASGSYSKLEIAKSQQGQSCQFIEDNKKAINNLNIMIVKDS